MRVERHALYWVLLDFGRIALLTGCFAARGRRYTRERQAFGGPLPTSISGAEA